jgi:hypothetical protein
MIAQQLIDGASFGPEAFKAVVEAFDGIWAEIAGNFGNDPLNIEAARLKLATALPKSALRGLMGFVGWWRKTRSEATA